jgi:hypothetical protein
MNDATIFANNSSSTLTDVQRDAFTRCNRGSIVEPFTWKPELSGCTPALPIGSSLAVSLGIAGRVSLRFELVPEVNVELLLIKVLAGRLMVGLPQRYRLVSRLISPFPGSSDAASEAASASSTDSRRGYAT